MEKFRSECVNIVMMALSPHTPPTPLSYIHAQTHREWRKSKYWLISCFKTLFDARRDEGQDSCPAKVQNIGDLILMQVLKWNG